MRVRVGFRSIKEHEIQNIIEELKEFGNTRFLYKTGTDMGEVYYFEVINTRESPRKLEKKIKEKFKHVIIG